MRWLSARWLILRKGRLRGGRYSWEWADGDPSTAFRRNLYITNGGFLAFLRNQLRLFKTAGIFTSFRSNLNLPG
jgi:hypothetical protein